MKTAIVFVLLVASSSQAVEVTSDDGKTKVSGRGVLVADDLVLTAASIVPYPTVKVNGQPATVARIDRQKGLAALRVEGLGIKPLPIGDRPRWPHSSIVRVLAKRPFDAISIVDDDLIAVDTQRREALARVPATGTDIGSAVIDDSGQLVGIFTGGIGNQVNVAWIRPAPPAPELPPGKSGYHLVEPGMPLDEVKTILGYHYTESASSATSVIMVWDYSDFSDGIETVDYIHCLFVDGKLVSKSKTF